jgi:hypothetical protein
MALFDEYFDGMGLDEYQAAMAYKQKKYGGGNGGGNLGGQPHENYGQPPAAFVPPAVDQKFFNPPQQQFVAPPSNERSHEQYLMDLQNEQEAAYLRDNPPPVTVASLGGSPLADPGFQVTGTDPATAGMAGPAYVAPVKAAQPQGPSGIPGLPGQPGYSNIYPGPLEEVPIAMQMDPVTTAQRATIENPYYTARAYEIMMNMDENRHLGIYDVGDKYWPNYWDELVSGPIRAAAVYTGTGTLPPASQFKNISNEYNPLINYNWQQAFPGYSYEDFSSPRFEPALRYHPAQIQMGGITYPLARDDQAFILEQLGQTLPEDPVAAEAWQNYLQTLYGPTGTGDERYGVQIGRYPERVMGHEYGHAIDPTVDTPYGDALSRIRTKAFADHFAAVEEHANRKRAIAAGFSPSPPTIMSPGIEADTPFNTLMANFPGYGTGNQGWGGDQEFFAESMPLAGRLGLDAIPPNLQRFYSPFITNEYDPVVRNIPYLYPTSEPQPVMGWVDPQRQFAGAWGWHDQYADGIIPEYTGNPDLARAQHLQQLEANQQKATTPYSPSKD